MRNEKDWKDWRDYLEEESDKAEQYLAELANGDKSHYDEFRKLLKRMVILIAEMNGRESFRLEEKKKGELNIIGQ